MNLRKSAGSAGEKREWFPQITQMAAEEIDKIFRAPLCPPRRIHVSVVNSYQLEIKNMYGLHGEMPMQQLL